MDHSFENLGPDRFQQLVQALLMSANPRTVCFPIGQPDGGRDAVLPAGFELGKDEFTVFQVKYSRQPAGIKNVSEWLLEKAEGELEKIERLKVRGATQYFLVTNVPGSAHLDAGSIDKTIKGLNEQIGIPIHCWFRDDLNRLLDGHWDIKLRYPEVLSGHDFFRILVDAAPRDEQERRLYELSVELSRGYAEAATVSQQFGVVETIHEKCRNNWGLRPAIAAAQIEMVLQRRVKASSAPFDFFAQKMTTTQRLRGGKARRADSDWWLSMVEKSTNASKSLRLLLIEGLLVLCPTETIEICETSVAAMLDSMTEEEWSTLVQTVLSVNGFIRRHAGKDDAPGRISLKLDSMRLSYLIAFREQASIGRSVFLRYFRTYTGKASDFLEFKQAQAVHCAIAGEIEWDEALAIVRDIYALGIHAPDLDYQLRNSPLSTLPKVFSEILSNPQLYPISLCDAAEAGVSRAARKAVRPVAAIAKAERWFSFDQ